MNNEELDALGGGCMKGLMGIHVTSKFGAVFSAGSREGIFRISG